MKWVVLILMLALCGCGVQETYETVSDEMDVQTVMKAREICVQLPEETLLPTMETPNGVLYLCNGYDIYVQTFQSGDLNATITDLCGFDSDAVTCIKTTEQDWDCYEFVWAASTELGEQVGRAKLVDDGNYHYALTAMTSAEKAEELREIWNGIFDSFTLI